ncbi:hypothetical protein C4D60_Mb07t15630 [Musa balbisiana]|uniref:E3 ubiquitin-protein ligase CCNB1IP1 homolog n=1 Tax=Musa balbisiana TaxID=52838 RepID=A0A4S8JFT1_MUSBA|nr:hypothetical protein C4D60_Mb07t15630 [Musa balbisiana]
MKSAYRSVMFYIGQQELEMNYKMKKIVGQCKQKCEVMQEKFTEKLEQIHTAYQKMAKRCQMMEQEIESLSKDKQELQEKYAEKSRQKRKLDEMYDQLRSEYESVKRSAIQPANSFFPGAETELFSGMTNMMGDQSVFTPETPGRREMWPSTKTANLEAFDLSGGSPAKAAPGPVGSGTRRQPRPPFGAAASNPAVTALHDLIISPMKRPQLSRNHARLFTKTLSISVSGCPHAKQRTYHGLACLATYTNLSRTCTPKSNPELEMGLTSSAFGTQLLHPSSTEFASVYTSSTATTRIEFAATSPTGTHPKAVEAVTLSPPSKDAVQQGVEEVTGRV